MIIGFILIAIILIVGGLRFIVGGSEDDWICSDGQWVKHGNPSAPQPNESCGEKEINITVSNPAAGTAVNLPFKVIGTARVFENTVSLKLKDASGAILYEGFTNADSPDMGQFGAYEKEINYLFKKPASQEVTLEVFWDSPKDGSELDAVSAPIKLILGEITTLKIFYNNSNLDPEFSCNKVFPVERVILKTQTPARAALELLLAGTLGRSESRQGFFSNINPNVQIKGLVIKDGVAKADFDEQLEYQAGGSCRVSAIRAQITETLKQIPGVKNVVISIDGRTEDILQP